MGKDWTNILSATDKMMGDYKFKDTAKHSDPKMAHVKFTADPKKGLNFTTS